MAEERTEYRVVVLEPKGTMTYGPFDDMAVVDDLVTEERERSRRVKVHVQTRTVTETPWEDMVHAWEPGEWCSPERVIPEDSNQ